MQLHQNLKLISYVFLIQFYSACLPLIKIYTLNEGVRFLEKYKHRKSGFVKAVKEMAVALTEVANKRKYKNKVLCDVLQIYKNY